MTTKIEFSEGFRKAAVKTACYVAQDGGFSRLDLAELVLDAGRMKQFAGESGKQADAEAAVLIKEHGFPKVVAALARVL